MTLGSHQRTVGGSQNWITPKHIIIELGPFDLDPAAAFPRPWHCAEHSFTSHGLTREWFGRIWLNPPFDRYEVGKWVRRLADHGNGMALLHARTEAKWFDAVWEKATAILFLSDRLYFHYPDGQRAAANSGAPACLASFGAECRERLCGSNLKGVVTVAWRRKI